MTCPKDSSANGFYISAASLLLEYRHFIDSHEPLSILNNAYPIWPCMVNYCEEVESHPELMQAITRLHTRSQIDFERALFCSWISLVIAKAQNLATHHQRSLFLAGLLQDLGKHSVDESVQNIISKVNGPYCSTLLGKSRPDNHPLVSSTYIEKMLSDVSVRELILHHHARFDGTGYPHHIGETQLDIDQQILIIANEISDRLDMMGGHNNLPGCIPMLRISSQMYFEKAYQAWLEVLSNHFEIDLQHQDPERARVDLNGKREKLEKLLACLISLSGELLRYDFDVHVHGLRSIIQKLANLFTDTGALNKAVFEVRGPNCAKVFAEMEVLFKGVPDVLERCKEFIDQLLVVNKYEFNRALLSDAQSLINDNIRSLGVRKASIFH